MRPLPHARPGRRFAPPPQLFYHEDAHRSAGALGSSAMHAASPERDRPRLTLFGGPILRRSSGVGITLTPSHERLLTLVWGHEDHGIARGSAIWLLWEEEDNPRSRQRLRQLLHDLGVRLGFRPVASAGEDHLAPGSGLVASDLDDYSVALVERQLQNALSLHRRGFASRL